MKVAWAVRWPGMALQQQSHGGDLENDPHVSRVIVAGWTINHSSAGPVVSPFVRRLRAPSALRQDR